MLINFFVWTLQCIAMYVQKVQFSTCFAHENTKNPDGPKKKQKDKTYLSFNIT